MRELILSRLENIREHEQGMKKSSLRWNNVYFNTSTYQHISEIDFNSLSDSDLFSIFELVIIKFHKQM